MATNNIQFKIGSDYVGEGFKRAKADIQVVNQNVKKGAEAVGQLQGALGEMDAGAAKALGAMTGLAQAILSFNATAIATQVAMLGINYYFGQLKEKAEAAQKRAEDLRASMEKAFSSAIQSRVSDVNREVKSISEDFERVTKQANQFAAALEGVRSAEANGGIISLQVEKLNALLEAHSDEQRANIEAAYNLKIAIQRSADTETAWQARIESAHQAVVDNESRRAKIDEQISAISEERKSLEEAMFVAKQSGDQHWLEIQKQVTSLLEQEQALEQKKLDAEAQTNVLRVEEQKVKQEAINAQGQATAEILAAQIAEKKLTDAKHARAVKEEAARDAAELKEAADRADALEIESAAELQRKLNESTNRLKAAEDAYAKKLDEYYSSDIFVNAMRDQAAKTKGLSNSLMPVDVQKGISLTVADKRVDDAIRNGTINTVKDAERMQRMELRKARDKISATQAQQLLEAKKYKRLQEMNPKALASSDVKFMQRYEQIVNAANQRKKDLEKAKSAVEDQKRILEDIDLKLDSLGLK